MARAGHQRAAGVAHVQARHAVDAGVAVQPGLARRGRAADVDVVPGRRRGC
jgi:hypothetical protein